MCLQPSGGFLSVWGSDQSPNKMNHTIKITRTRNFCGYRSYRFNELVHAHYFREGVMPCYRILRDYFQRATAVTLRDNCPRQGMTVMYV